MWTVRKDVMIALIVFITTIESSTAFSLMESPPTEPLTPLSLPPTMICPPSLDTVHLTVQFNNFNTAINILNEVQFSEETKAVFTNGTKVVYLVTESTLGEAESKCDNEGIIYKSTQNSMKYVFTLLSNIAIKNDGTVALKVDVGSTNKPETIDGKKIKTGGDNNFVASSPYIIFKDDSALFAKTSAESSTIVCQKNELTLGTELKNLKKALTTHVLNLEHKRREIIQLLSQNIPKYTNDTLGFDKDNNSATLVSSPEPYKKCLPILLRTCPTFQDYSTPTVITTANIVEMKKLLEQQVSSTLNFAKSTKNTFNKLKDYKQLKMPSLTSCLNFENYLDLLSEDNLSISHNLIVFLVSILGGSVTLYIVLCILCVYMARSSAENVTVLRSFDTTANRNEPRIIEPYYKSNV